MLKLNFSQVFFIPMSLYPLMYLDKKKNKGFFSLWSIFLIFLIMISRFKI